MQDDNGCKPPYRPLENTCDAWPPEDDVDGRWKCQAPLGPGFNFIEVHLSSSGRNVTLRISEYDGYDIQLGDCVLLSPTQVEQLIWQLTRLRANMP